MFCGASALGFYVLYVVALNFFAIRPAVETGSAMTAVVYAGFFGLVAYGTYDLSNLSTMKAFPASVALLDMAWGTVLSAASAFAGFKAATYWS